jgi:hypothetical protein
MYMYMEEKLQQDKQIKMPIFRFFFLAKKNPSNVIKATTKWC